MRVSCARSFTGTCLASSSALPTKRNVYRDGLGGCFFLFAGMSTLGSVGYDFDRFDGGVSGDGPACSASESGWMFSATNPRTPTRRR